MQSYEHRILNGLLRELPEVSNPEQAQGLLFRNVEICVGHRADAVNDLWPCVWALVVALSKQFSGTIFLNLPSAGMHPKPTKFDERVIFDSCESVEVIRIGVGVDPDERQLDIYGDARGNQVSVGSLLDKSLESANPISCFALAGYLGMAALGFAVGIPSFAEEYAVRRLELPFDSGWPLQFPKDGLAFLGLGQLGQAYLALLFFLSRQVQKAPPVFLLDKDRFESPNEATQILLEAGVNWCGSEKTRHLESAVQSWGFDTESQNVELDWTFQRRDEVPQLAFLGFDNFEARRIAINAGFEWIVEAGIGTSLIKPRITWHSFLPTNKLGKSLFAGPVEDKQLGEKEFFETLRKTPGQCGWFSFKNVSASAPCMGLAAAAYAWAEAHSVFAGSLRDVEGAAYLWPSLLPFRRDSL